MFQKNVSRTLALLLGVFVLSFLIGLVVLAWTEPISSPPEGNVSAPINVSNIPQSKAGGLGLGYLLVDSGTNLAAFSGKVVIGAGAVSPTGDQKLDVAGTGRFYTAVGGTGIRLETSSGSGNAPFILWKPDAATNNYFGIRADTSALRLGYWPSGGSFASNLVINTAGNVGIGTTNPNVKLEINGDVAINKPSGSLIYWYRQGGITKFSTYVENGNMWYLGRYNDSGGFVDTPLSVSRQTGNVGIGTPNPAQKLDINGTAKMTGFQLGSSATAGYVLTTNASGVGTWQTAAGGGVGGNGTADFIPRFKDATTLENSLIKEQWYAPLADGKRFVIIGESANAQVGTPRLQIFNKNDEILALVRQGDLGVPRAQTTFRVGTDKATVISDLDYDYLTLKTGNVGIGTTSPETALHVVATPIAYQSAVKIDVNTVNAPGPALRVLGTGNNSNPAWLEIRRWDTENKKIALRLANAAGDKAFDIKMPAGSNDIYFDFFGNAGDGEIILKENGNVGIGTLTDPITAKLDINGQIRIRQGGPGTDEVLTSTDSTGIATWKKLSEISGGGNYWTQSGLSLYANNTNWSVGIGTIAPQGKLHVVGGNAIFNNSVGIGTVNPQAALHVAGNIALGWKAEGGSRLLLTDQVNTHYIAANNWWTEFVSNPNEGWKFISNDGASVLEKMRITAGTGNVGINTTSPTEKLEVVGNIRLNVTAADRTLMFGKGSANIGFFGRTSDSAVGMYDWANSREVWTYYPATNRFAIMSNNVGIGTTSPGVKLDVSGDIRTNAGITLGGVRRTTWPASDFYYAIKINDYPAGKSGGTETVNCLGGYSRIACSGGVIHTGANDNEDNEAFIVRPNSSNGCEIKWEDDPVGSKTVEVYAYCLKF